MNKSKTDPTDKTNENSSNERERIVYVVPREVPADNEINVIAIWNELLARKWLIAGITAAFTIVAVVYALFATEWYRAEVLLSPVKETAGQGLTSRLGALGGLAGLAGIDIGPDNSVEALAILKSRDFNRQFIEENDLLPVLLYDEWDEDKGRWIAENVNDQPDIRDAVKFFDEEVRRISKDSQNGLVTLSVDWTDPILAAEWATALVTRLNAHMRERTLSEAEHNTNYLSAQLESTNVATLRESIGSLLETELQKLMLANGAQEFSFRIIDSAQIPKEPIRPRRFLIVLLAIILGGMVALLFAYFRYISRQAEIPL